MWLQRAGSYGSCYEHVHFETEGAYGDRKAARAALAALPRPQVVLDLEWPQNDGSDAEPYM